MLFLEEPNFVWDLHFVDTDFFLTKNHFGAKRSQNSDFFYLFLFKNILDLNFVRSKICLSNPDYKIQEISNESEKKYLTPASLLL